jgi:hypothetical protein
VKVTIFYSWQSDSPNSTNRGFIRTALDKAVTSIKAQGDLVIEPRVDTATADVSGTPDIAATILSKIDKCQIFVGDVSIINPTARKARKTPNPNVLLELGYAAKHLGWDNVICVCNTVYGTTEQLPFDLRMRRICGYSASKDGENKAEERDQLASKLRQALHTILQRINQQVQELATPKLLTPERAGAEVREFLEVGRHIQLSQLTITQGNELAKKIGGPEFTASVPLAVAERTAVERVKQYEELSRVALAIMITGCYYGTQDQEKLWTGLLQRVATLL